MLSKAERSTTAVTMEGQSMDDTIDDGMDGVVAEVVEDVVTVVATNTM